MEMPRISIRAVEVSANPVTPAPPLLL